MAKTGFFASNGTLSYLPSHPIYSIGPRGTRLARRWEEWRKVSDGMGSAWIFQGALILPNRATRRDIVDAFAMQSVAQEIADCLLAAQIGAAA